MNSEKRLKVVLVDDEDLLRSGMRLLLSTAPDIEVVAEASNGRDAVPTVLDSLADVVLMDIRMPVDDGISAVQKILSVRTIPIIMLTAFDTDEFIVSALRSGAVGFLLKTTSPATLLAAVRAAAAGQPLLSPEVIAKLLERETSPPSSKNRLASLSEREVEVAHLVARGMGNQEIADTLYVSITTVKTHIKHILDKIGGTSRVHIAIAVLE